MQKNHRSTTPQSVEFALAGPITSIRDLAHGGIVATIAVAGSHYSVAAWGRARDTLREVGIGGVVAIAGYIRSKSWIDSNGATRWHLDLRAESVGHVDGGPK